MRTGDQLPARSDVVVIGSGIFAYNLTAAGMSVTVIERGDFCGEASGANVGLITSTSKEPGLLLDLGRRSVDLYTRLDEILGRFVHFEQTGSMTVAITPEGLEARRDLTLRQQAVGVDVYHLDGDEARELEPSLPEIVLGSSYCPHDGVVYPFAVVAAYLERAMELGMRFVPHTDVVGVDVQDGRVQRVRTTRGTIATNHVVNAAGAWAGDVAAMAGLEIPVIPVRGQVLVTEPLDGLPDRVILGIDPSIRATWAANGLIGSTKEYVGFEKKNKLETMRDFARGLTAMFPHLTDVQVIRGWSGLRPGTPDEMIVLGESEQISGFVTATGAFRNGMLYGPAVGEVIRDVVLGKPPAFDLTPARPERFETASIVA
jgi:glycine/D-amino acid oxidase-like deaminating enzyme